MGECDCFPWPVWHLQTASRRRRIARGAGRTEVDVTNMIGSFSGMRSKMQSLSKMMKMGGGGAVLLPLIPQPSGRCRKVSPKHLLMRMCQDAVP